MANCRRLRGCHRWEAVHGGDVLESTATIAVARNVLEEIQQNGQDASRSPLDSNREREQAEMLEEEDENDSELTELERQIVAKYLSELEASEDGEDCDLNNNCPESAIGKDEGQEKQKQKEEAEAVPEKEKVDSDEDKENQSFKFPTSVPKGDLLAMSTLLRQFPQLNRRTSLESTGDSVEDLVSACPQIVNYIKQHVAATAAQSSSSAPVVPESQPPPSSHNVSSTVASTECNVSPSSKSSADSAAVGPNAEAISSGAATTTATTNRRDGREVQMGELIAAVALQKMQNAAAGKESARDKNKKDKIVKRRPNYSVWMGVTSCIWGLLFYLVKTYL